MERKLAWATMMVGGSVAVLLAYGCSSDNKKSTPGHDGGTDSSAGGKSGTGGASGTGAKSGTGGGGVTDGGDAGTGLSACTGVAGVTDQVSCGQYIVQHIDACADCHSPTNPATGAPDYTKALSGNPSFADLDGIPGDGKGNVPTPNLTLLKSQGWLKADIKDAILNGNRPAARGGGLFPIMPYYVFHNMSATDADAVVAYIYQLTPLGTAQPGREPIPSPISLLPLPIAPLDATKIPDTTLSTDDANYEKAVLGKYMASGVGICVECHSEHVQTTQELDTTKLFAGGQTFVVGGPFGTVTSLNITPDKSGIAGWTPQQVQTVILKGKDNMGVPLCPPMPFGPLGAFGGMDPNEALAIGYYLTSIPGVKNGETDGGAFPMCVPPGGPPPGDGSTMMSDAGAMDAGDAGKH
jgi:hypothetical protein